MRLKHSNKKQKLITQAASKLTNPNLCNSYFRQPHDDHSQQLIGSRKTMQNSQQINMQSSLKSNFKECRIREFIGVKNHAPTDSDMEYIDTIDNYIGYLKRTRKVRLNSSKKKQKVIEVARTKKLYHTDQKKHTLRRQQQCVFQQFQLEQGNLTNERLREIKEKIDRVTNLSLKYNSERQVQDIYENIYKVKTEESEVVQSRKQSDHFQLVSLQDYMDFDNNQLHSKEKNDKFHSNHKGLKKRPSQEAKRWYQPKSSQTQRKIDPQGLIQMINLRNLRNQKQQASHLQTQKFPQTKRQQTSTKEKHSISRTFQAIKKQTSKRFEQRPNTAPYHKTLACQLKSHQNQSKSRDRFLGDEFHFKQKVQRIHHVGRQKYGWREFKRQLQNYQSNGRSKKCSQLIFEYPWNKKTKSLPTHNRTRRN